MFINVLVNVLAEMLNHTVEFDEKTDTDYINERLGWRSPTSSDQETEVLYTTIAAEFGKVKIVVNGVPDSTLEIPNAPVNRFEEGVIYEGAGIRFQYVKSIEYNGRVLDINDIVFNRSDLKKAGIIIE